MVEDVDIVASGSNMVDYVHVAVAAELGVVVVMRSTGECHKKVDL